MYYITGASGDGLGFELAKRLVEAGLPVIDLSPSAPSDDRIGHIDLDLANEESVEYAVGEIKNRGEKIAALINCAGVMTSFSGLDNQRRGEIERVFKINVEGPIYLTSLLLDKLLTDEADVINVASTMATRGVANEQVYSPSKWAVRGHTKCLQEFFKGKPSRAICFMPGGFQSKLFEKAGRDIADFDQYIPLADVADLFFNVVTSPKTYELSEVIANRKGAKVVQ
ncbi:SDR family NAD(P)-dependent oxidoreductase [Candidatus Saccharibacteria bacterium]|jgi:NAD(P)-dependent dehydrogenase (short-subunit alcohol dehydrogenase family)|nr:SDR family NAD(P)-dependent oxidoreductase [Candidatus Saccharibacteria bacterium]